MALNHVHDRDFIEIKNMDCSRFSDILSFPSAASLFSVRICFNDTCFDERATNAR